MKLDERVETQVNTLPLTRELFDKDALVYTSSDEMKVSLINKLDERGVTVTWKDMPYFGLWSPYPNEAPLFVSSHGLELLTMKILMATSQRNLGLIN